MANNYEINYNDERLQQVESDKKQALSDLEKTYAGMAEQANQQYQEQIAASKAWADKQSQLQQEQTDFVIDKIGQEKAQAQKDYTREQSGAYADWQKQSNQYGVNAEQMAAQGMSRTGFAESAQVSMYNQYQNRVAIARESYQQTVQNYNNAIKDAQIQNNSVLAEIALEAQQRQLELSLQGLQYQNQLLIEQFNKKTELDNLYHGRWQDVLAQINQEYAMSEEIRQFNEQMALQRAQLAEEKRQHDAEMAYKKTQSTQQNGSTAGGKIENTAAAPSVGTENLIHFDTYREAAEYLAMEGITGDGGLMSPTQWKKKKAAGDPDNAYCTTYQEYLAYYVHWRMANPI